MTTMTWPARLVVNGRDLGMFEDEKAMRLGITQYQAAAVAEGFCPVHERGLDPEGRCPAAYHAWRIIGTTVHEVHGQTRADLDENMTRYLSVMAREWDERAPRTTSIRRC